jgi:hypothetical protein
MIRLKLNWLAFSVAVTLLLFFAEVRAEQYPFGSDVWETTGEEVEFVDYLGNAALRLKGGNAILKGVELQDGVIEFDIAISEIRGFSGVRFRLQEGGNFEHFYVRPHQSGNPDANQYTPVFNGVSGWQLYHGKDYATPVQYRFDEWMHIKVVFQSSRAEIYVDSDEPTLLVPELKRGKAIGGIGVDSNSTAPAYFANFEVLPLPADYTFTQIERDAPPVDETMIMSWQISDVFSRTELSKAPELEDRFVSARDWTRLAAELTGITNLARVQGIDQKRETAIARLVIRSDSDQIKGLSFGYSDAVSVFVNGKILYSGSNMYMSRDYRYLGTIGLFDKVHLPLKEGDNEIWFALSEAFGGWGIQAQFDDLDGINVVVSH